jgi:iron uptake system component EfeO
MRVLKLAVVALLPLGCAPATPQTGEEKALGTVKQYVTENLETLVSATQALRAAAPAPDADGWNATADRAQLEAMKAEWKKARSAYEHIEGAIAVLFPDYDVATDERYDGFIAVRADDNLFDGDGVTGIHALERILYSDAIPQSVIDFESGLPGYKAAAFPANEAEARAFKDALCARLVTDVTAMRDEFKPLALDTAAAYRGVIGSMEEQLEKTTLAATGEEESRYAQYTLADMRANVEGGKATFEAFRGWIRDEGGSEEEAAIVAGFDRIAAKYAELAGDSLPPVPATWSSLNPSSADQATAFGKLYVMLRDESDPKRTESTVSWMNKSADRLGIPQLPQE